MTEDDEETVAQYRGVLIIEWPAPRVASPYNAMPGWGVTITDAVSGKVITTCTDADIVIHAGATGLVTADLNLFADEDGEPIFDGRPVPEGDGFRAGVFPFLVGEMRVRS